MLDITGKLLKLNNYRLSLSFFTLVLQLLLSIRIKCFSGVEVCSQFDKLPPEIIEKIFLMAVQTCGGVWPCHGIFTYNSIKEVCVFWKIVMLSKARKYLPSVYLSLPEVLPRG